MKRTIILAMYLAWASAASAFQPRTGFWWNPAESGRGFNMDIQDGVLVVTVYAYQAGGAAQWYLASGVLTNAGRGFTGTLDRYQGGQCIACSYGEPPVLVGNDGVIVINFTSETAATVILPGGFTTSIRPHNFAFGDPPQGLLGEWVFVYDTVPEGRTSADRFDFTWQLGATANGNGLVYDVDRFAGCELQVKGALAGFVACVEFSDPTLKTVTNLFIFHFGLDQTYDGVRALPSGLDPTAMKGFKVGSNSGLSRIAHMSEVHATRGEGAPTRSAEEAAPVASMANAFDAGAAFVVTEMRRALLAR